jgi:hypothetical protein
MTEEKWQEQKNDKTNNPGSGAWHPSERKTDPLRQADHVG